MVRGVFIMKNYVKPSINITTYKTIDSTNAPIALQASNPIAQQYEGMKGKLDKDTYVVRSGLNS